MSPEPLAGRRATVMGLGLFGGGVAAARHLARRGARVTVTDLRGPDELGPALDALSDCAVELALGGHREADFRGCELLVVNPAVPPGSPWIAVARAAGARVTSEAALFLEATPARVAAVTGTQGKSSTCHMLAGLLEAAGLRTWLGGNIGRSLLEDLDAMRPGDRVVMELSSYQLETLPDEVPRRGADAPVELAVVTNVLADHLERHGDEDAYRRAKLRLLELLRPDGEALVPEGLPLDAHERGPARFVRAGAEGGLRLTARAFVDGALELAPLAAAGGLPAFQRENALLALGAARRLGAPVEGLGAALAGLGGLPHRLELLGHFDGHAVWDNGVSTTPDSTVSALRALEGPCCLLVGGRAKRLPFDELVAVARERAVRVVLFGAAGEALEPSFARGGARVERRATLEEAVALALARLEPGEALLFSPACASFDAYLNFRERALAFRRCLPPLASLPPLAGPPP